MRILYVEDEKFLAQAIAQALKRRNYAVDLEYDGLAGLDMALLDIYDIVILDIMLPNLSGIEILREMRKEGVETPVILLTAKSGVEDKVEGLDCGADDYLSKPFQVEELLARLRALGRRKGQLVNGSVLVFADIELNYNTLELRGNGKTFHLTLKESQLLELLINNKYTVISTNTIIEKLWGWDSEAEDSHVQVHVAFLRKKLKLLSDKVKIKTTYGVGYVLQDSDDV
ncbi:MAG: response regulator transcription factor [Clostridiales bacterium]|jgi:DNA-binding response OmpR family regulator|nr:response regulator transcription factor [Clostridiales bacterium]MDR2752119.1 response regulator transcription factor [Clostridiales bacterium]